MDRSAIEPGRAPLVGRARELAVIADVAARAAAGDPQVLFIEGEPGLGKTRLLAAAADYLADRGWTVMRGDVDELPSQPPYGPFVTALRSWSDANGIPAARAAAGAWARHLAALVPELDAAPATTRGSRAARTARADPSVLAEGWAQFLRAIGAAGPLLIAADDFQWADQASRELLRYLRRRLRGTPLLVACADRGESGPDGPAASTGGELARARLATVLLLGRLDSQASRDLAAGLIGGAIGATLDGVVQQEGEGHPFIIEELLRGLVDGGRVVRRDGRWDLLDPAPAGLPRGVRDALDARLATLPAGVADILRTGSVAGRRFSAAEIASLTGADPPDVEAAIAIAAGRRFVRSADDAWEFTHDKIRETLYAALPSAERQRLHQGWADLLSSSPPVDPRRLAAHALRGDRPWLALPALAAVADGARAAGAWADAAEALAAAVGVLRAGRDEDELARMLMALGGSLTDAGRYDEAVAALEEALRLAERQGLAAVAAGCLEHLAAVHLAREHAEPAAAAAHAALDAVECARTSGHDGFSAEAADAAMVRVRLLLARLEVSVTGRLGPGVESASEARRLARATGDARGEAEALALLGQAAMHGGDFDRGRQYFDEATALADPVRDPALAADTADGLARLLYWTSAFHAATAAASTELEAARRTGNPHRLGWPMFWLAQCALCLGDWDEVRMRGRELVDLGSRLGARRFEGQGHEMLGLAAYWTGDWATACSAFEAALAHLRLIGPGTLVYYLGPYGLALVAAGRTAEAEAVDAELRALAGGFDHGTSPRVQAFNVAARLRLAMGRADPHDAAELAGAERQHHWYPVASTLAVLALPDRPAEAARRARTARDVITADGGSAHLAELLLIESRLALLRRDAPAASRLRRQFDAFVQARGIAPEAAGAAFGGSSRQAERPVGGELSNRERQVLDLVARGFTNREIADTLDITEKTAINHVTHILNKLGVTNRAAAAAWAARDGLGSG